MKLMEIFQLFCKTFSTDTNFLPSKFWVFHSLYLLHEFTTIERRTFHFPIEKSNLMEVFLKAMWQLCGCIFFWAREKLHWFQWNRKIEWKLNYLFQKRVKKSFPSDYVSKLHPNRTNENKFSRKILLCFMSH